MFKYACIRCFIVVADLQQCGKLNANLHVIVQF